MWIGQPAPTSKLEQERQSYKRVADPVKAALSADAELQKLSRHLLDTVAAFPSVGSFDAEQLSRSYPRFTSRQVLEGFFNIVDLENPNSSWNAFIEWVSQFLPRDVYPLTEADYIQAYTAGLPNFMKELPEKPNEGIIGDNVAKILKRHVTPIDPATLVMAQKFMARWRDVAKAAHQGTSPAPSGLEETKPVPPISPKAEGNKTHPAMSGVWEGWSIIGGALGGALLACIQIGSVKLFGPEWIGTVQTELVNKYYPLVLTNYTVGGAAMTGLSMYLAEHPNVVQGWSPTSLYLAVMASGLLLASPIIYTQLAIWNRQIKTRKQKSRQQQRLRLG